MAKAKHIFFLVWVGCIAAYCTIFLMRSRVTDGRCKIEVIGHCSEHPEASNRVFVESEVEGPSNPWYATCATRLASWRRACHPAVVTLKGKFFFSVGAIFKNEGQGIDEWIKHYLSEGVEHFFLIDDVRCVCVFLYFILYYFLVVKKTEHKAIRETEHKAISGFKKDKQSYLYKPSSRDRATILRKYSPSMVTW